MARNGKYPQVPLETFSHVVEAIYDCALDPHHWQHTISLIAKLCQSQSCALGVHDCANGHHSLILQVGCGEHFLRFHENTRNGTNVLFASMGELAVGAVATQAALANGSAVKCEYHDGAKSHGLRDTIIVKLLQTGQRIGFFSANRVAPQPCYGHAEIRLLNLLSPHVCRAVAISDALNLKALRSEALEATLNTLAAGVYLTDCVGRLVFMNSAAEHQLKTGKALRIENGFVAPIDQTTRAALAKALAGIVAEEAPTSCTLAFPDHDGGGLVASILPLVRGERRNVFPKAAAAIFVQDPVAVRRFPNEAFARLYNLTASELRVLCAMAPGLAVKEAAEVLGISATTAKTHLHHIYAKTDTSKQTELMHLFMRSTPPTKVM